ncbi:MAG TPA: nuclear transport factor 2 family protein [Pseudonocardiaceae bacterium]
MTAELVRRLTDRADLADLADRYLRALDDGVFDQARAGSVFTDDVELHFPPGDHSGIAGVVEFTRGFMRHWARTHHTVSNYVVELDGDRATIAWNVIAVHVHHGAPPPPASAAHFHLGGRFDGAAVRTRHGWRLRRLALRVVWTAGPGIPSIAATMANGTERQEDGDSQLGKATGDHRHPLRPGLDRRGHVDRREVPDTGLPKPR